LPIAAKIRELGDQGWELVAVTPISNQAAGTGTQQGYADLAGFYESGVLLFRAFVAAGHSANAAKYLIPPTNRGS
jgi:hypothetical protein